MSDTKKLEITRACRIAGKAYKIGDIATVGEEDFLLICGMGKGISPTSKAKTEKKDK